MINIHKTPLRKSQGKRRLRRQRRNFEADVTDMGRDDVNSIQLAQGRIQWRNFVGMVKKWSFIKEMNFFRLTK
jgi:hypothetical protein